MNQLGALDSETSVQVMDLLKDVAKDRLVVMVTHNPELAENYANLTEYLESETAKEIITNNLSDIIKSQNLDEQISSIMEEYMKTAIGSFSSSLQREMESSISALSSSIPNAISIDGNAIANAFKMKMNEEL